MSVTPGLPPLPQKLLPADDSSLLAALRTGEETAYDQLVKSHAPRMLAVARGLLRHEDDARDAVQDAFLSAFRGLDKFDGRSQLSTWLHRIVINASLMRLRARRRKPEQSIEELLPRFLPDGHQAEPAPAWGETADVAAVRRESCEFVRACIDRLPDSYRTVLLLRDIEEVDTAEAAELLGVTSAVVKTRLHRARQALRTLLDPHFRGGET